MSEEERVISFLKSELSEDGYRRCFRRARAYQMFDGAWMVHIDYVDCEISFWDDDMPVLTPLLDSEGSALYRVRKHPCGASYAITGAYVPVYEEGSH